MEFNINAIDLIEEIYEETKNKSFKRFPENTNKAVIDMAILTVYNEVVNKGNVKNLVFEPSELENINTTINVKLNSIVGRDINSPIGREFR